MKIQTMFVPALMVVLLGGSYADATNNNPDLIYDPSNGNVKIRADGSTIGSFSLINDGMAMNAFTPSANFMDLDNNVGFTSTAVDNTTEQIGWVSALVA
ncbi:MAG: hypothetical protein MI725_05125, partial [Pirellulales bacterium]|nr:hypothetical protein [Pirellulales bacterium]